MQNRVENFSLVYDFKAGDDYIPNCLNHDTTKVLFENGGNIRDEVMSDYFKNYIQIPVLKENLNVHWDIFDITTIYDIKKNKKNRNHVYLYAVEPFANINHILGTEDTYSKKCFVEYMSKDALDLLKTPDNKFYCIINFCNEGTMSGHLFDYLYNICERYHIPCYKLIFVIACADVEEIHNQYCEKKDIPKNKRIHVQYWTWSIKEKADEAHEIIKDVGGGKRLNKLTQETSTIVMPSDLETNKDIIRNKKFLMFNRRMRDQRVLFISLFGKKFIEENYISYDFEHCHDETSIHFFENRINEEYWEHGLKNMKDIITNKPKSVIDFEEVFNTVGFGCEDKQPFLDSYIHLTSETNFSEPGVYFSEKTWKPIINLQPFIMMNYSNSLPYLKELGFKTFSPFIDETYDTILDKKQRAKKTYEEIVRLNNLPIQEIHEWYTSIKPILLHNRDVLMKNHGDVMMDIECKYVESLKSYVNNIYNKSKLI
tara:strand:+ start:401 stop:1852 length:1452 start_codon:yes stop_codon:yes gene_type:complete